MADTGEQTTSEAPEGAVGIGTQAGTGEEGASGAPSVGAAPGEGPTATGSEPGAESPEGKEGEGQEEAPGAPETYEAYQLPEGFEIAAPRLEQFNTLAKELNLPQDNAQKLISMAAEWQQEKAQEAEDAWAQQITDWGDATKRDPEIAHGDLNQNIAIASRAVVKIGGEQLQKALADTYAQYHPEVIRAFLKLGRLMKEDDFKGLGGEEAASDDLSPEQTLFGATSPN